MRAQNEIQCTNSTDGIARDLIIYGVKTYQALNGILATRFLPYNRGFLSAFPHCYQSLYYGPNPWFAVNKIIEQNGHQTLNMDKKVWPSS